MGQQLPCDALLRQSLGHRRHPLDECQLQRRRYEFHVDKELVALLYKPSQWEVTRNASEHDRRSIYLIAKRNLRVPFLTDGRFKILSFRSKDPQFKTDPGVVPNEDVCEKSGITVVQTGYRHTDMSDHGSDDVKSTIEGMLDKFLEDDSPLKPVETTTPPAMTEPGPVALYAPVKN